MSLTVKASAYNAEDPGSIPELGRSSGEENSNPLQYSHLENPMVGGACWATLHGITKSRTRLRDFTSKPKIFANERILLSSTLEQKGKCLLTLFSLTFFLFLSFILFSCSYTHAFRPRIKLHYQISFHIKTEN